MFNKFNNFVAKNWKGLVAIGTTLKFASTLKHNYDTLKINRDGILVGQNANNLKKIELELLKQQIYMANNKNITSSEAADKVIKEFLKSSDNSSLLITKGDIRLLGQNDNILEEHPLQQDGGQNENI